MARPSRAAAKPQRLTWGEIILLTVILALAAYLRLNSLEYAQMRADDANLWDIVVSFIQEPRVLTQGIPSSLGLLNGPFQAYLLLLAIPFTREPIGAYVVVAVLNILAALACWGFSRAYFGPGVALIAALLFAANPWAVIFSRRLWGNDMTALFTVLLIWSLSNLVTKGRLRDSLLSFFWLAILVQTYVVALVNLATMTSALAFIALRLQFVRILLGLALFILLVSPYAGTSVASLANLRRITDQTTSQAITDTTSLWYTFHIVGNEGYQAFANQAGSVFDSTVGLPLILTRFLQGIFAVGLAVSLFRVARAFKQREYTIAAPYLMMAVPVFLPMLLLVWHTVPVYPYYLIVGYPMHFVFSALGAQWLIGLGGKLPETVPLLVKRIPATLLLVILGLAIGMQLMLAQVFFTVIREYWLKSDYGLPLFYVQRIAGLGEELVAAKGLNGIYLVGPDEHASVLYTIFRRRTEKVFYFNGADTFVAPAKGHALYIVSNSPTKIGETFSSLPVETVVTLPVPGGGLIVSFVELGAAEARPLLLDSVSSSSPLNFNNVARLDGASLEESSQYTATLTLKWTALSESPFTYSYYFRLIDSVGVIYASLDAPFQFSGQWRPGDQVVNWLELPRPKDLPPGQYWYLSGLYYATSANTYQNLPLIDAAGNKGQDWVRFGPLVVRSTKRQQPMVSLEKDFERRIALLGYDLDPGPFCPGKSVRINLHWQAETILDRDYTVFVHLLNEKGQLVAQHDSQPDNGRYPTSIWHPGDHITDAHVLNLPKELDAGTYQIAVGLYYLPTMERLGGATFAATFPILLTCPDGLKSSG